MALVVDCIAFFVVLYFDDCSEQRYVKCVLRSTFIYFYNFEDSFMT